MLRLNGETEQEILETIQEMRENPLKTAWNKENGVALTGYTATCFQTVL